MKICETGVRIMMSKDKYSIVKESKLKVLCYLNLGANVSHERGK